MNDFVSRYAPSQDEKSIRSSGGSVSIELLSDEGSNSSRAFSIFDIDYQRVPSQNDKNHPSDDEKSVQSIESSGSIELLKDEDNLSSRAFSTSSDEQEDEAENAFANVKGAPELVKAFYFDDSIGGSVVLSSARSGGFGDSSASSVISDLTETGEQATIDWFRKQLDEAEKRCAEYKSEADALRKMVLDLKVASVEKEQTFSDERRREKDELDALRDQMLIMGNDLGAMKEQISKKSLLELTKEGIRSLEESRQKDAVRMAALEQKFELLQTRFTNQNKSFNPQVDYCKKIIYQRGAQLPEKRSTSRSPRQLGAVTSNMEMKKDEKKLEPNAFPSPIIKSTRRRSKNGRGNRQTPIVDGQLIKSKPKELAPIKQDAVKIERKLEEGSDRKQPQGVQNDATKTKHLIGWQLLPPSFFKPTPLYVEPQSRRSTARSFCVVKKNDIEFTDKELAKPLRCCVFPKNTRRYFIKSAWNGRFVKAREYLNSYYALAVSSFGRYSAENSSIVVFESDPSNATFFDCWIRRSDYEDYYFFKPETASKRTLGRGKRLLASKNDMYWNCQKFEVNMVGADAGGILMQLTLKPNNADVESKERQLIRVEEDGEWLEFGAVKNERKKAAERNRRELFYLISDRSF